VKEAGSLFRSRKDSSICVLVKTVKTNSSWVNIDYPLAYYAFALVDLEIKRFFRSDFDWI
jgi:hypothetical protein